MRTGRRRQLMITFAVLQNMMCGGLLYGWAAIAGTMLEETKEEGGAGLTESQTRAIFVVASTCSQMGPLTLGALMDVCGPRVCNVVSLLFVSAGCFMFGLSDVDGPNLFMPGMVLISCGGPGVQTAIIHISNLFPQKKATATSAITGAFSLSFLVFMVFHWLWYVEGVGWHQLFMGYGIAVIIVAVVAAVVMPDTPYSLEQEVTEEVREDPELASIYAGKTEKDFEVSAVRLPSVYQKRRKQLPNTPLVPAAAPAKMSPVAPLLIPPTKLSGKDKDKEQRPLLSDDAATASTVSSTSPTGTGGAGGGNTTTLTSSTLPVPLKRLSLMGQLTSGPFLRLCMLMVIGSFWGNFYIAVIPTQLGDQAYLSVNEQLDLLQVFTGVTSAGVVGLPAVGYMMDHVGFPPTAFVTLAFAVMFAIGVLLETKVALLCAFVAYSLFRTFLFSYFFGYLGGTLGFRYFGVLSGMAFASMALANSLQIPLASYGTGTCHLYDLDVTDCDQGNWQIINYAMLASFVLCFIIIVFDRKKAQEMSTYQELDVPPSPSMPIIPANAKMTVSPRVGETSRLISPGRRKQIR